MYIQNSRKNGAEYATVEVKNGEIIFIDCGDFHEGGLIWHKNWLDKPNGDTHRCMRTLVSRGWDTVYERVRELCPGTKLPPLKEVKMAILTSELIGMDKEIDDKEEELKKLRTRRNHLDEKRKKL